MPNANHTGECESAGEINPATSTFTSPVTKPESEVAIPRRAGKRFITLIVIDGNAKAEPIAYMPIGITAHGSDGLAASA
jgi:hypothetical protein